MALFGLKKKDRVLDLTEKYKKQLDEQVSQVSNPENSSQVSDTSSNALGFFGGMASAAKTEEPEENIDVGVSGTDERKKKLAKRLMDMTDKIEDFSNQIYHLQQRIEVLERKSGMRME